MTTTTEQEVAPSQSEKDTITKLYRYCADGKVEKVFVDHGARPRRSYGTGEFYRPLDRKDGPPGPGEEDIMFLSPETFEPQYYRRVSPIDTCIFAKPFDSPPGSHLYPLDAGEGSP